MLVLIIIMTEEIVQKAKIFVQIIIYNGKLNKTYLSTRVCVYKNLKTKLSILLSPDPDSLVEELKSIHLQSNVLLNALKAILPSLNIDFYRWKVNGDYAATIYATSS